MAHIDFSVRELQRAWRDAYSVYASCAAGVSPAASKSNSYRLLLFYCVECGLKAVYLKRQGLSAAGNSFVNISHNLNALIDGLKMGHGYLLPNQLLINSPSMMPARNAGIASLNQVWRYGATLASPFDSELEAGLLKVNAWIVGELN